MKHQEKVLRRELIALRDAAKAHISMRDEGQWLGDAVISANKVIDATDMPEMEQLREWLIENTHIPGRKDTYDTGYTDAMKHVIWHISHEHGYGGEDADEG
jgi:hypothetical protein